MGQVIQVEDIAAVSQQLKKQGKKIVLVGGCFDILHPGHVIFLEKAKSQGNSLFVLLESDQKVRLLKGANRPVHSQKMRAKVLTALQAVDYVIMLPFMRDGVLYDDLIATIRPDVIAISGKNTNTIYHQRSARLVGAKLKVVTRVIKDHSTSRILLG